MWSERVLVLLDHISDMDRKMDITLELLRRLVIPWPSGVDSLVTGLSTMTLKRSRELKEQVSLMELKKMIMSYGINDFNMSDLSFIKRSFISALNLNYRRVKIDFKSNRCGSCDGRRTEAR
jgi:hypothetical protein